MARNLALGLFRIALFVLGCFVGVCGSLFGLIGTQAMKGDESFFEIFLGFGIWHTISWGLGGLIATGGFPVWPGELIAAGGFPRKPVTVLSGFVGGGVIAALILAVLMRTGVGFNFYSAIVVEILVPPAIGGAMVARAMVVARTLDNSNASDSTQEAAG